MIAVTGCYRSPYSFSLSFFFCFCTLAHIVSSPFEFGFLHKSLKHLITKISSSHIYAMHLSSICFDWACVCARACMQIGIFALMWLKKWWCLVIALQFVLCHTIAAILLLKIIFDTESRINTFLHSDVLLLFFSVSLSLAIVALALAQWIVIYWIRWGALTFQCWDWVWLRGIGSGGVSFWAVTTHDIAWLSWYALKIFSKFSHEQ